MLRSKACEHHDLDCFKVLRFRRQGRFQGLDRIRATTGAQQQPGKLLIGADILRIMLQNLAARGNRLGRLGADGAYS